MVNFSNITFSLQLLYRLLCCTGSILFGEFCPSLLRKPTCQRLFGRGGGAAAKKVRKEGLVVHCSSGWLGFWVMVFLGEEGVGGRHLEECAFNYPRQGFNLIYYRGHSVRLQ